MNKDKEKVKRIIIMNISLLLSAISYNLFLQPLKLVSGGTGGIAIITKELYGINPALMILLLSIACIIIGFLYLGKEKAMATIAVSIIYPIFVELTSPIIDIFPDKTDALLLAIFAGIISGVAGGLIYKSGYNSGGLSVFAQVLYEKKKISIAKTNFVMNGIIVLIGAYFFGFTNALYAVIYLYFYSIITDKVLLGISNNKAFYIITDHEEEVKNYITNTLNHTVTVFDVKGGFQETKRRVILTVIPSREYYLVTEGIKNIDKNVFFTVTDSYQVKGAK